MDDLRLRQSVLDELEFEPSVDAAHIGVIADKGVITLSGYAHSYAEKQSALEATRRIKGVQAIADEITVRFDTDKKTSDDEIAKRATDILRWDTLVPVDVIQLTVHNGWITLSGSVDWYYQRVNAEQDVRKLSGVLGVLNNIEVKPRLEATDIKQKIEDALKRRAEVESKGIRVTIVDRNRVRLEGSVNNLDEKIAVESAAWSASGVRWVDDRMTIS